jgi:RNA polymerase sigma-70 factor, ECF subfamily
MVDADTATFDFEAAFESHFRSVARVIFRVVQDPSRAEELAVDVFWKLSRHSRARGPNFAAWLYRSAVRAGLDELRKRSRRQKYEHLFGLRARSGDPEEVRQVAEHRTRITTVLAALKSRDAQLVALRAEGLSYAELAHTLELNSRSVGTMLSRAQESFRKEYVNRYGEA